MKAIEAYYRILGGVYADRYVPIGYENEFITPYIEGDDLILSLENYNIDTSYSIQKDVDEFDDYESDQDVLISCFITFNGEFIRLETSGWSDHYEGDIDSFKVALDEDYTELFKAIKYALDDAVRFLEDYESDYNAENDDDDWY